MADYELRSKAISSGLVKQINDIKKKMYHAVQNDDDYMIECLTYELLLLENDDPALFKEACNCKLADRSRATRLKKRIAKYMSKGHCIFLTLTFRNDVLDSTSEMTRRDYVARYLKSCSNYYVGNVDFGDTTDREHYHALVVTPRVDMSKWKYGYAYAEHVYEGSDPLRLSHYISKLTNHAIKETCRRYHIIYSRDVDRFSS